ncbi:hypothetical protein [Planotetraspora kaengkrachanensis]|uniref:Beta-xylosidase n=1 Tax=Planotetraspora kaengkrachanensis TaxID=575193 RepID=A0A8J3VAA4_9ACTN|nr:hypothetical protein [Planotetraspora kaengkrachanensis]GIG83845.1 hypothetical protein Pka01_69720 [Planotetraspora kaengkrachanensis]
MTPHTRLRFARLIRLVRRSAAPVLAIAAVVALTPLPAAPANAADATVTVDLSRRGRVPTRAGAGFLYGLSQNGSGPADGLLQPLRPTLFRGGGARIAGHGWIGDGYTAGPGYQVRLTSALDQARRVTAAPYGAAYHLLVSDVWGADTEQPASTVYPCDNGDCANWRTFIGRLVADVRASGVPVRYDIWNEPEGTSFWPRGVNSAQYFQMWDTAVNEIRRLDPAAVVVGPSFGGYNRTWINDFLARTKADGTLPNVLNWHFSGDPVADAADARSLLSANGIPAMPLTMDEYLFSQQQNPGYLAWYLGRLAQSDISAAAHAIWSDCCVAGTLDSVLTSDQRPTGQWWVYQAYAQMTGNLVATTNANGVAVAAAADQGQGRVIALLGNQAGQTGTTTVAVSGLSSAPWLVVNGTVRVKVERIPHQSPLSAPFVVSEGDVAVTGDAVAVPVTHASGTDAYTITLTPGGGTPGAGTVTVDGNTTGSGDLQFQYGPNWGLTTGVPDMYAGTANWSHTAGATATFRFTGTQVALRAVRDVDQGRMTVSVDGDAAQTVDDYSPSRDASGVVWTSAVLSSGSHTLTIVNTGQRNSQSGGVNIALDRADVSRQAAPPPTVVTVDGNTTGSGDLQFQYGPNWGLTTGVPDMYAGTANWSYTAGATATFRFTGTRVALRAVRDRDQQIIALSVDGGPETTVDDYSPTRDASGVVWTSPILPSGAHTLRVRLTGVRNAASSGDNAALDSVDVTR